MMIRKKKFNENAKNSKIMDREILATYNKNMDKP